MTCLADQLTAATTLVFEELALDRRQALVRRSDRADIADFQCNGALAVAKAAERNPREVAAAIAQAWTATGLAQTPDIAGPGFLNFRITDQALAVRAQQLWNDPRAGATTVEQPRRVLVDYGGTNVAKPMHVGHLRSSIIGESLKRIFRFRGDTVWGDVHLGDWGFQMGLLVIALEDELGGLEDAVRLEQRLARLTLADLDAMYPTAAARAKQDLVFRDRARKATLALQAGETVHRAIWRAMHEVSMIALKRDFAALGVSFDLWNGESDADPYIPAMLQELRARQLIEQDAGAQVLRVARPDDKYPVPPLLVISSEGSAMYGTTDLATIVQREQQLDPDLYLYVVDQRQADHFVQVFRAAELAGWVSAGALEHIGFGTVNGADGKPFKTRAGGVLKLNDLIEMVCEKARARLSEADIGGNLAPEEFAAVARCIGVAALKIADLQNFRGTSYVFELDRFMSFQGRTGPYLLYAAVRIKSLLRNAAEQSVLQAEIRITNPSERDLLLILDAFDAAVRAAYEKRAPHLLVEHAFALAQCFSVFYRDSPVLSESRTEIRGSRLALAAVTLRQLQLTLDLLGLEIPERM